MTETEKNRFRTTYIIAAIICVGFLIASLLFVFHMMEQNQKDSLQDLQNVTTQNETAIKKQIQGDFQTLRSIAVWIGEDQVFQLEKTRQLLKIINDTNAFVGMGIADKDGTSELFLLDGETYENVRVDYQSFFKGAMQGKETVTGVYKEPFWDEYVNYYGMPIFDGHGKISGVLYAAMPTETFRNIVDAPVFNGQGFSNIINSQGVVVVRTGHPDAANMLKLNDFGIFSEDTLQSIYSSMEKGQSGNFSYMVDKESQMGSFQPIGFEDWFQVSVVPEKAVMGYYNQTALGVVCIIMAACLIFLFLLHRQVKVMKDSKEALMRLAYTDPLIGCKNYNKFLEDAQELVARRKDLRFAVWYCDIKRFKYFNDTFGYQGGDRALIALAKIFEQDLVGDAMFCRVSADHFAGIRSYKNKRELEKDFQNLLCGMEREDVDIGGLQYVELCMGCYCMEAANEEITINEMVNRANMVQNSIKHIGGHQFAFFTDQLRNHMRREKKIELMQKRALEAGEFTIYMQPKMDIQNSNQVCGAEVLARWDSSEYGMVSPAEFIPIFERNGFVAQLDRYVFEAACKWLKARFQAGYGYLQVAVNVSRLQLFQEDFVNYYGEIKEKYQIPEGVLELEFTESVVLDDKELFEQTVLRLKEKGFMCSLDDFGSGYSSLNVLKNLPIDVLKLDMLFFKDIEDKSRAWVIVVNVINMARELNVKTIAEGVETKGQVEVLRVAGCDIVQGYYFAKPMPLTDFDVFLEKKENRPAARN